MSNETFVYSAKKRRHRTVRIFHINRVVVVILLIMITASLGVTYFAIKHNNSQNIDKVSYYFIQMGTYTSSGDALIKSAQIKEAGGAGYVINDGIFRVMATVFLSYDEASAVQSKLADGANQCEIYQAKTKKQSISKYDNDAQTKQVKELLTYPRTRLFVQLQAQDMALDKGETTASAALLSINSLRKELADRYDEIRSLLSKHPADNPLNSMEKSYKKIIKAIDDYLPLTELVIGNSIKSILCAIAEIELSLA